MKKYIVLTLGLIGFSFTFGANYSVKPVNNWLAKKVIEYIFTDKWLAKNTTLEARIEAAKAANKMSQIIVNSIKKLGIHKDWFITDEEVKKLNDYIYKHYHKQMVKLHWDDEKWKETWFHKIVNNWWITKWRIPVKKRYKSANRVADGIFHLWLYPTVDKKRILNEDWNKNVRWRLIARALSVFLKDDLNLKHWSKKAYYKAEIKRLRKQRNEKIAKLKKQGASKKEILRVKKEYNQKIKELRRLMRSKK